MDRRVVAIVVCGALVTALFAYVATAEQVSLADSYPTITWDLGDGTPRQIPLAELDVDRREADGAAPGRELRIPDFVSTIVQVLLAAGGIALLVMLWNRRPRLTWRRSRSTEDFDLLDDLASIVVADARDQRAQLATGEPRNAIVACWLRLESQIEAAGHRRDPADTSEEFTARILSRFAVDAGAVDRLAALYREARFSSHEMGEAQRRAAISALDAVHDGLRSAGSASATGESVPVGTRSTS